MCLRTVHDRLNPSCLGDVTLINVVLERKAGEMAALTSRLHFFGLYGKPPAPQLRIPLPRVTGNQTVLAYPCCTKKRDRKVQTGRQDQGPSRGRGEYSARADQEQGTS